MDTNFLKEQLERCRSLADKADMFTRKRLLALAEQYESRLGNPSAATRILRSPWNLPVPPERERRKPGS
jgi:hypothetical protein